MQSSKIPRWGQAIAGGTLLAIAVAAGVTGLKINVMHGLELRPEAGILFGLADISKLVLPVVCGLVGWSLQTRLVALVCVATSVFCAITAFNTAADRNLAGKQHGADQYGLVKADVARLEADVASLNAQATAEAKKKGCGTQCKFLTERADRARQDLVQARAALKTAAPVEMTGTERLTARISSVLFLILIEALVWMSVPAMTLLAHSARKPVTIEAVAAEVVPTPVQILEAPRKARKPRRATKQIAKLKTLAITADTFGAVPLTKKGTVDKRRKIMRPANENA